MQLCPEYLQIHINQNVLCRCIFQYKAVGTKLIRKQNRIKSFSDLRKEKSFLGPLLINGI